MTQPNDDDIIPIPRASIRRLAYCRNMLKGYSHERVEELAKEFSDRLVCVPAGKNAKTFANYD